MISRDDDQQRMLRYLTAPYKCPYNLPQFRSDDGTSYVSLVVREESQAIEAAGRMRRGEVIDFARNDRAAAGFLAI